MRDSSLFSNLSNTPGSSALTSVSRRSRGTCCIGLKAATAQTTVPSSNWKSLKSLTFKGSLITHDGRLRDNEPRKTRHSRDTSMNKWTTVIDPHGHSLSIHDIC